MFELADTLLGVYKVDNMSYCIHVGVSKLMNVIQKHSQGNRIPPSQSTNAASQPQSQPNTQEVNGVAEDMQVDEEQSPEQNASFGNAQNGSQGNNSSGLIIDDEENENQAADDGTTETKLLI